MTTEQKKQITKEIKHLCALTSQNKVATKACVSSATISQMINENWALIKDEMWRKVKVKLRIELDWKTAQTTNLEYIYRHAEKAKEKSISFGISYDAGAGKSQAYKLIANTLPNVIHVECKTFWKSKSYAKALVTACGLDDYGTTEELVERFIDHLSTLDKPLVIIDQMDKLKDGSMDFFIDFYNDLVGHCGFLLSGVPALEKRIKRGVKVDRTGYFELWSRIGRKFLKLKPLTLSDVKAVCIENGLTDNDRIETIFGNCEGDLRRVKQDVESYFLNQKKTA
jgi:DNA transposition AAA+ family ATPase